MAYTSPSYIGNAIWNNAAGSPVISPSRWQTQVLDNLCVLANHDHSGSAGGGASTLSGCIVAFTGQAETITPFFPSACTSWSLDTNRTNWPGMGAVSTSTNGASIAYDVYWGVGVHTVTFFYGKGSAFGIIAACLSGASTISSTASYDGWKSGAESPPTGSNYGNGQSGSFQYRIYSLAEYAASGSVVTGSLVGSGKYSLVFKVSGSSASSTGYIFRLGYMSLI